MAGGSLIRNVDDNVWAVVPAAGRSRRMGQAKQLMSVQGRPMLLHVVDALIKAGVDRVVVVTHRAIRQALSLDALQCVHVELNDDETSEMIDSICQGLRVALASDSPPAGIVILPGDQPDVRSADIRTCVEAFQAGAHDIVVAVHGDTRGHPLMVSAAAAGEILSASCTDGLRGWVHAAGSRLHEVACTAGVTQDVDTPEDYKRLAGDSE